MNNYYPALTGLRAVAAFMVFLHHSPPMPVISALQREMHIGVTFFFVLSGFLIALRYGQTPIGHAYFMNRMARIMPLYLFMLIPTLGWEFYQSKWSWEVFMHNILLTKGLFEHLKFSGIPQSWSLTVEELFYWCAPLFFASIRKRHFFIWLWPILLLLLGLLLTHLFGNGGFMSSYNFLFLFTFFGRSFEFFAGIALAWQMHENALPIRKGASITGLGLLLLLGGLKCLSLLASKNQLGADTPIGIAINTLALPLVMICILYGLLTEKTMIRSLLESKLFQWLGKASYAFYLIHVGIFQMALQMLGFSTAWQLVLLQILALLLYLGIEKPIHHLLAYHPESPDPKQHRNSAK